MAAENPFEMSSPTPPTNSPQDRSGHIGRRVRGLGSEIMDSLKSHFSGGDGPAAPSAPSYSPAPTARPAGHKMLTAPAFGSDTTEARAVHKDRVEGLLAGTSSSMGQALSDNNNSEGNHQLKFSLENAARRLSNHASGAGADGTHLMSWERGRGGSAEAAEHTITGPHGETIGGGRGLATRGGDPMYDPRSTTDTSRFTDDSAAKHNIKRQGPGVEHFISDVIDKLPTAAGAGGYHMIHKITLTPEGEAAHKTKGTMTLDGASSSGGGLSGRHNEGQRDSSGRAPIVRVLPEHIQKIESHINPSVK